VRGFIEFVRKYGRATRLPEMNQQLYSQQEMNQYLLGSLPDVETERLDELSLTDAEFADALAAAEKDLIDAYVQGELAGAVLQRFKSHYLASPGRRVKVEFAQAFQVMAEKHQAAEADAKDLGESRTKRKVLDWFLALGIFRFPRPVAQWGLAAAALVLFLAGGWLLLENTGVTRREPATRGIATFVLTPQTRDAGQVRTLSIPSNTDQVMMELQLEPNDYSDYRVELRDASDDRTLWRSDQVTAQTTGNSRALRISLPARLLNPQTYLLRVTGVSANGVPEIVGEYPFQL
jgi:hypothetical protein